MQPDFRTPDWYAGRGQVSRPPLTAEEFYERYFSSQGIPPEIAVGIRKILEEQLGADMSRLQAEDDFSKNLNFFWDFDSMADVEIVVALEKHFGINISDAEAEKAHTVSDLIHLVSNKSKFANGNEQK